MAKVLQIVHINNDIAIYITDCNTTEQIVSFRVSDNPSHKMQEKYKIENGLVYTKPFYFSQFFIDKFLQENQDEESK